MLHRTAALQPLRFAARPASATVQYSHIRNMSKTLFQAIKEDHEEVRSLLLEVVLDAHVSVDVRVPRPIQEGAREG